MPADTAPPAPRRAIGRALFGLLGGLAFLAGTAFLAVTIAPGLRDDLSVRATARQDPSVRLVTGRCKSRLFLLQHCEVTLAWRGKEGSGMRDLHYLFVEPHAGNWTVHAVADPARPHLVTTDLGLERITNRIATAAVMLLGALVLAGSLVLSGLRDLRGRAA
ncbi:hypothetical protein [Roseomonas sp. HF4]|uniref:hypothetical protein n=1 Tax=Roseomonas sp. HF4 TaxID=2562313 RepID=UPI0010BFEFB5|nr:hypothetical protein [Roseomonas sp. HF4]